MLERPPIAPPDVLELKPPSASTVVVDLNQVLVPDPPAPTLKGTVPDTGTPLLKE
jgi:hypothetical protein